eukprot:scaffold557417_cov32-Prasinocladus_malaysianus.AAC.1
MKCNGTVFRKWHNSILEARIRNAANAQWYYCPEMESSIGCVPCGIPLLSHACCVSCCVKGSIV